MTSQWVNHSGILKGWRVVAWLVAVSQWEAKEEKSRGIWSCSVENVSQVRGASGSFLGTVGPHGQSQYSSVWEIHSLHPAYALKAQGVTGWPRAPHCLLNFLFASTSSIVGRCCHLLQPTLLLQWVPGILGHAALDWPLHYSYLHYLYPVMQAAVVIHLHSKIVIASSINSLHVRKTY